MPVLQSINELGGVRRADHVTHWAALKPVFLERRGLVSEPWLGPADTLWVGDQGAANSATTPRGDGIHMTAAAPPLQ